MSQPLQSPGTQAATVAGQAREGTSQLVASRGPSKPFKGGVVGYRMGEKHSTIMKIQTMPCHFCRYCLFFDFLTVKLSWIFFPKKVALKIFLKTFCCCIKGCSIYVHLGKSAHVDACWVHSSQDLLDEHVVLGGPPTVNRLSLPGGGCFPQKEQISPENE